MDFTVVGAGYVGASSGVFLARKNRVVICDISHAKLEALEQGRSPIPDPEMDRVLAEDSPDIRTAEPGAEAYRGADFILIATPTNFDSDTGQLDTSSVEGVIADIAASGSDACVVVKSTIPSGFMGRMAQAHPWMVLLYAPEFLREGRAMYDQLHPSRIVVGTDGRDVSVRAAERFVSALVECAEDPDVPTLVMGYGEAEAVKLFSNTYLAMRVAFFNELDTLAEMEGFDAQKIIDGVCLEPRIGDFYNNPSFGYGGYCLPKDTRQLLSHYETIPQRLILATVEANETRMRFITERIVDQLREIHGGWNAGEGAGSDSHGVVGVYRLVMKNGSDNLRESSMLNIVRRLRAHGVEVLVYEPVVDRSVGIEGCELVESVDELKRRADLIVANRDSDELADVADKLYTRDIFRRG